MSSPRNASMLSPPPAPPPSVPSSGLKSSEPNTFPCVAQSREPGSRGWSWLLGEPRHNGPHFHHLLRFCLPMSNIVFTIVPSIYYLHKIFKSTTFDTFMCAYSLCLLKDSKGTKEVQTLKDKEKGEKTTEDGK